MNSELKKQILESLTRGLNRTMMLRNETLPHDGRRKIFQADCDKISATIAAVESEPEPTQKLTFEQIEACFPDGEEKCDVDDFGMITCSPQWLHDFARSIESTILDSLKRK